MAIREQLEGKNDKERANIKGREIVRVVEKKEIARGNLKIDVVDVREIEGGVEVFARAFRGRNQIGFGEDGSVDVERFRVFNPPILVPDPNGDIVRESTDSITGEVRVTKYREDPEEALLQSLEHTIGLVGKDGKIDKGKVGNTTSTFYAGTTDPIDGRVERSSVSETMATIRAGAGTGARTGEADDSVVSLVGATITYTALYRSIFGFNTSSLPDTDVISSATFSLYGSSKQDQGSQSVVIDRNVPASSSALVNADFNLAEWDGVEQTTARITIAAWSTAGYNDFTLNAAGIGNINKTGNTWYGGRISGDFDNSAPVITSFTRAESWFADDSGTSRDPKLVVVHAAPVTFTPSPMLHMMAQSGGLM